MKLLHRAPCTYKHIKLQRYMTELKIKLFCEEEKSTLYNIDLAIN